MRGAERLITTETHDKWHENGVLHGAFHDLLFKALRNEEALTESAPYVGLAKEMKQ
jgi:hypothetical protein